MRRTITIVLIIAAIAATGWFGYQKFGAARQPETPEYEIVKVLRGDIESTVSATGTVLPERQASLSLQGTGIIETVSVKMGDHIPKGQVLVQQDATDAELAIRQAEIGLRTAQIQLRQLQVGPSAADLASAEAGLASAQAAYQDVLTGSTADQLASARAQVEQARATMVQAQQAYDKIKDMPNAGMMPQSLQLQQATIAFDTAQAQYRVTSGGASEAQKVAAQAQIAQAEAALDRLKKGSSSEQIEIAQASVDQAQVALEQAQRRLENTRLIAPWDGVVTAANIVEGTLGQPGAPAIELADLSQLHVDVQVDEMDVAALRAGQPVTIEVDAVPDASLTGVVKSIAPSAEPTATGGVSYNVRVDILSSGETTLLPGMSATTSIVSSSRQDVLLVPNRAVQRDRTTGQTFVHRIESGVVKKVEVRLGLRDDQRSEVLEGLNDNDELAIYSMSFQQQIQQSFGG